MRVCACTCMCMCIMRAKCEIGVSQAYLSQKWGSRFWAFFKLNLCLSESFDSQRPISKSLAFGPKANFEEYGLWEWEWGWTSPFPKANFEMYGLFQRPISEQRPISWWLAGKLARWLAGKLVGLQRITSWQYLFWKQTTKIVGCTHLGL